ncbi:MAG: sulfatase-like hydrolase/transferase, partial [Proteobacteria bacterium]|nr:sulfatase-like hydrolase/transferase [Pseudomonadota bacterium]
MTLWISLLAAMLLSGCGAPHPPARPNILLVSLDTLRADHLSTYGYERLTSPFLSELASQGVKFERAFVNTLATTVSHTTMLSSLYQETHRVAYHLVGARAAERPPLEAIPTAAVMV